MRGNAAWWVSSLYLSPVSAISAPVLPVAVGRVLRLVDRQRVAQTANAAALA